MGQDGGVVRFKIKMHTQLKRLITSYCNRARLDIHNVKFRFDGLPLKETDTPAGLDMEDEDTIEVFQQQTGGDGGRC